MKCRIVTAIRFFVSALVLVYGVTAGRAQPQPTAITALHVFGLGSDGQTPFSSLVLGSDNSLYGTTEYGGTNNGAGTVFKMNRDGSGYSVLHNFDIGENEVVTFLTKPGAFVMRGRDGTLYGGTQGGTVYSGGILFKMNTDGSGYAQLYIFTNNPPTSLLQLEDGELYGSGLSGPFKIDPDGNNYTTLHTLNTSTEGRLAYGKLILGSDGFLYGTAAFGGSNNLGTLYKLDTSGTTFTVLHTFGGTNDGARPYAGVIEGDDGALYGTTYIGGTNNAGTVYKIYRDGSGYVILHHFQTNGIDGQLAYGGLVESQDHIFYGATALGGTNSAGTIYEITANDGGYKTVYTFDGPHGIASYSTLAQGPAFDGGGVLYGVAKAGGTYDFGTLFGLVVNPPLSITPAITTSGNNPVVVWPGWALNYQLQQTTNLTNGTWSTVTNGLPVTGLQLTNVPSGSYYRLIWNPTN